jgi:outer membrane biosynthesis protein TonB
MSNVRTATGFDRLPWLADEPQEKPAGRNRRAPIGLVAAGALVLAGASYWFAHRTTVPQPATVTQTVPPATTAPLPLPQAAQPQVEPDRVPEVEPVPLPAVSVPEPVTSARRTSRRRHVVAVHRNSKPASVEQSEKKAASAPAPSPAKKSGYPTLWPSRVSQGASGRLVQIGAFGSRYQAKRGWWAMVRAYPALKRLPTVVNDTRNSKGRRFYRLQIGTTSQAHSEVLCQKMQRIHYSCAVVGLPGERKAVER